MPGTRFKGRWLAEANHAADCNSETFNVQRKTESGDEVI